MPRPQTLMEISNDIVASAIEILAMSQKLKKREHDVENLELGAYHAQARTRMAESLDEVMRLFPILAERRGVSFPCFPEMTDDEIEAVCRAIR